MSFVVVVVYETRASTLCISEAAREDTKNINSREVDRETKREREKERKRRKREKRGSVDVWILPSRGVHRERERASAARVKKRSEEKRR